MSTERNPDRERLFDGAICALAMENGEPVHDPDLWHPPEHASQRDIALAMAICRSGCPVLAACLDWGLRHEEHGIWGGLSASALRRERRRCGITLQAPAYLDLLPTGWDACGDQKELGETCPSTADRGVSVAERGVA